MELNSDVRGDYVDEGPEQILSNSPDFFNNFTVVVTTALPEKYGTDVFVVVESLDKIERIALTRDVVCCCFRSLILLSKILWELNIPLIVCRSLGFVAYMRVQVREHTVIETHPDNEAPDLRLDNPFDALKSHMDTINLEEMDLKDHAHVPYVVILYKYLEKWISEHGDVPKNYQEKQQLREEIRSGIRKDEHGNPIDEENFEEAIKAVNTSVGRSHVNPSVMEVLNDDCCVNLTAKVRDSRRTARQSINADSMPNNVTEQTVLDNR